jgi:hypothetical protein
VGVAVAGDVIAIESPKPVFDKSRCGNAYVQETGSRRRANHFFQLSYNPETVDSHRDARGMNSLYGMPTFQYLTISGPSADGFVEFLIYGEFAMLVVT